MASSSPKCRPEVSRISDEVFIHLRGCRKLLGDQTEAIRNCLTAVAADPGTRVLYLDMGEVEYLSSAMVAVLVQVDQKMKSRHGRLRLRNVERQIYEVFHLMKLNDQLDIHKRE